MESSRKGSPLRRLRLWAGTAACGIAASVGCQVEYAGMTLPSGKYMHDDVQYFPPGPAFPFANTLAATQRSRLAAQGLETFEPGTGPVLPPPPAAGALEPSQSGPGQQTNVNTAPLPPTPEDVPPPGGAVPPPGGAVPAPETPPF